VADLTISSVDDACANVKNVALGAALELKCSKPCRQLDLAVMPAQSPQVNKVIIRKLQINILRIMVLIEIKTD
jgi:hypothetical protein